MNQFTLDIPQSRSWSDDDLFEFCVANKDLRIERDSNGFILIMSPSGGLSGYFTSLIIIELGIWNKKHRRGLIFDSSSGFILPDGSMKAPDLAYLSKENWKKLTKKEKTQFPPLCPEFLVEVRSPTDRLPVLQKKMEEWIKNGAQLAWLIDPNEEKVHIYRPKMNPEIISGFNRILSGESVLEGFVFDLAELLKE